MIKKPIMYLNFADADAERVSSYREQLQEQGYQLTDSLTDCDYIIAFLSNSFVQGSDALNRLSFAACSLRKPYIIFSLEELSELPAGLAMLAAKNGIMRAENIEETVAGRIAAPPVTWAQIPTEKRYAFKPFEASENDYAFVSYAHDDNTLVYPIIKTLYEQGWNQWYDEGIRISERYLSSIAGHVRDCSVFLLFVTDTSINRPFVVEFELAYAARLGKPIIPVLVEEPLSNLPVDIRDKKPILPKRLGESLKKLGLPNFGARIAVPPKDKKGEDYDLTGLTPMPGFEYKIVNDAIKIDKYTGDGGYVAIPREHCGLAVTGIDNNTFKKNASVTGIDIPDSIVSIGEYAFAGSGLTEVLIPESVTVIGLSTFSFCKSLLSIKFPESLKEIPWSCCESSSLTQVTIPEGITQISGSAFSDCTSLARVRLPDTLSKMEHTVFQNCTSLTEINIPKRLTYIGGDTFSGCHSLTAIVIPDNITEISPRAFKNCKSLISVSIPDTMEVINDGAFEGCKKLEQIHIPDSVTDIGTGILKNTLWRRRTPPGPVYAGRFLYAYDGKIPRRFKLREDTRGIAGGAFAGHKEKFSITIPDGLSSIGDSAFENCESLKSISIPGSVTQIGYNAFSHCSALKKITLPLGLTAINDEAFSWCESLTDITIPDSVTIIYEQAFCGCTSLKSITIPDSVTEIREKIFYKCENLKTVYCHENSAGHKAAIKHNIAVCFTEVRKPAGEAEKTPEHDKVTDQNMKQQIEETPDEPFALLCNPEDEAGVCDIVRELREFGYRIKSAEADAISRCAVMLTFITARLISDQKNLQMLREAHDLQIPIATVYVQTGPDDLPIDLRISVGQIEGVFAGDQEFDARLRSTLNSYGCYRNSFQDFQYSIDGDEITLIKYNGSQRELYIPRRYPDSQKTVTRIADSAFSGCNSLTSVVIPDSVNRISPSAFQYCTSLAKVVIPDGVVQIARNAFSNCTSLQSIFIPGSVTHIDDNPFSRCSALKCIDVAKDNANYASDGKALFSKDLTELIALPAGHSGHYAIPEGVKTIGRQSLAGCASMHSLTIPESVTHIEMEAFFGCSSIESLKIPDSVTKLYSDFSYPAFGGCRKLKTVKLSRNLKEIEDAAFQDCYALSGITVPDGVRKIGKWSFQNCKSMTYIVIPASVKEIHDQTFLYAGPSLTIYTEPGSYAHEWAMRNSLGLDGYDKNGSEKYKKNWAKMYGIPCKPISAFKGPKRGTKE